MVKYVNACMSCAVAHALIKAGNVHYLCGYQGKPSNTDDPGPFPGDTKPAKEIVKMLKDGTWVCRAYKEPEFSATPWPVGLGSTVE